jgi:hypothetical protein
MTEQDLHDYNKWLTEVWSEQNSNIPFMIDAPKAYLKYRTRVKHENIKITFTDLEMSGTTLVKFLEVVKETDTETYAELKKQLNREFGRYFKENGIDPCV